MTHLAGKDSLHSPGTAPTDCDLDERRSAFLVQVICHRPHSTRSGDTNVTLYL